MVKTVKMRHSYVMKELIIYQCDPDLPHSLSFPSSNLSYQFYSNKLFYHRGDYNGDPSANIHTKLEMANQYRKCSAI